MKRKREPIEKQKTTAKRDYKGAPVKALNKVLPARTYEILFLYVNEIAKGNQMSSVRRVTNTMLGLSNTSGVASTAITKLKKYNCIK